MFSLSTNFLISLQSNLAASLYILSTFVELLLSAPFFHPQYFYSHIFSYLACVILFFPIHPLKFSHLVDPFLVVSELILILTLTNTHTRLYVFYGFHCVACLGTHSVDHTGLKLRDLPTCDLIPNLIPSTGIKGISKPPLSNLVTFFINEFCFGFCSIL